MGAPKLKLIVGDHNRRYDETKWVILIMNGLRTKTFEEKVTIKAISARTGLCTSTISKMMHGETKYPRHETVISLLKFLGYRLYAEL